MIESLNGYFRAIRVVRACSGPRACEAQAMKKLGLHGLFCLFAACTESTTLPLGDGSIDSTLDAATADTARDTSTQDGALDTSTDVPSISCTSGFHACGTRCASNTDVNSCGSSCAPCASDANGVAACNNGTCVLTCAAGFRLCGNACRNTTSDLAHCGECGRACNSAQLCLAGACSTPPVCSDQMRCPAGYYCAQGVCAAGCGGPNDCTTNESCGSDHVCACNAGYHRCGGRCVADNSVLTCGASCTPCSGDPNGSATCSAGSCGVTCTAGFALCGGRCVRTGLDASNCGTCGTTCSANQICLTGACVTPQSCGATAPCATGYYCNAQGTCSSGCGGPSDCGANETCNANHACECAGGYHRCDGTCVSNGALTSCGQSCNSCPIPQVGSATCSGVACDVLCPSGTHKCGNECVSNDSTNSCGSSCAACQGAANAVTTCNSGTCGLVCASNARMCGAGCAACPSAAGVTNTACSGDSCVVSECAAGYRLCGGACAVCDPQWTQALGFDAPSYGCSANACSVAACASGTTACADGCCPLYSPWTFRRAIPTPGLIATVAISADENVVAVANTNSSAQIYVYRYSGNAWSLDGTIVPASANSLVMDISGDGSTIAAIWTTNAGTTRTPIFVYRKVQGVWTQASLLDRYSTTAGDDLAINDDGTRIAATHNVGPQGWVDVYESTAGVYTVAATIPADNGYPLDMSRDGNRVAFMTSAGPRGYVRASATQWNLEGQAPIGGGSSAAISLSDDGTRALFATGGSGTVYVAVRSGSSWSIEATFSGTAGYGYGARMSGDGTRVFVPRSLGLPPSMRIGAADMYTRVGNTWSTTADLVPVNASSSGLPPSGVKIAVGTSARRIVACDSSGPVFFYAERN